MATVTVRVDGAGDYTSVAAAIAGETADLTATETLTINCVDSVGTNDSSLINIVGYTTNATNYIDIVGDGIYQIDWSLTSANIGIYFQETYTRVSGLILNDTNAGDPAGDTHFTRALSAGANSRIENCILSSVDRAASSAGTHYGIRAQNVNFLSRNNLIYNLTRPTGGGSSYSINQGATDYSVNCTVIGNANQSSNANGIIGGNAINCYAGDFFNVFASQEAGGLVNCASSDTSGSAGLQEIAIDNTVFLDPANDDYTLASGSALIGAGVGPTANSNVAAYDFEADPRSGATTDIGFDQLVDSVNPSFSAGPAAANVGARQMDVTYTVDENCTVAVIALEGAGQSQPSDATFDGVEIVVPADTPDSQTITGLNPVTTYTVWVRAADFSDNYTYASFEQATTTITPIITSVTPLRAGETATITGVDFGSTQGSGSVTHNAVTCSIVSWADTSIQFTVPDDNLEHKNTYDLVVTHDNTNSDTEAALAWLPETGYDYAVAPAPSFQSTSVWSSIVGAAQNDEYVYQTTAELSTNAAITCTISIDANGNITATNLSTSGTYLYDYYLIDATDSARSTNGVAEVTLLTAGGADTTPDAIDLGTDILDANPDTDYDRNGVISGADSGIDLNLSVTNATVSVNGGGFTSGPTVIRNGQTWVFRVHSSANAGESFVASMTVNGVSDSLTVTTAQATASFDTLIDDQSDIPSTAITPLDVSSNFTNPNSSPFSATGLPTGLTISTAGVISGTPTANGSFAPYVTLEGIDSNVFAWNISGALFVTTIPDQTHVVNSTVSIDLDDYFENPESETYAVDDLPNGLTLIGSIISGTLQSVEIDTTIVTLGAANSNQFTWTITGETFTGTIPNQNASVGAPITPINLLNYFTNPQNDTFVADSLPAGLSIVGSTISGTPTTEAVSNTIITLDTVQSNQFTWTVTAPDTTAPQLTSGPTQQNVLNGTFDVAFTFDESGEYRLLAFPDGSNAPTVDQVFAGVGNGGATPSFDSGLQTMVANVEEVVTVRLDD